jgi:hypothetical protein
MTVMANPYLEWIEENGEVRHLEIRNVSMKMRHVGLEFSVPPGHSSDFSPWVC